MKCSRKISRKRTNLNMRMKRRTIFLPYTSRNKLTYLGVPVFLVREFTQL